METRDAEKEKQCMIRAKLENNQRRNILIDQLVQNICVCNVCWDIVRPTQRIWFCTKCSNIFHLTCIQQWAEFRLGKEKNDSGEGNPWKCPAGCKSIYTSIPVKSPCFCGGTENPENNTKITPHSCGKPCNKKRSECHHTCGIPCHPGPCPSCLHRKVTRIKCQNMLSCGIHECPLGVHSGPCPKCPVRNILVCHCGKYGRIFPCSKLKAFSCGDLCGKKNDKDKDKTLANRKPPGRRSSPGNIPENSIRVSNVTIVTEFSQRGNGNSKCRKCFCCKCPMNVAKFTATYLLYIYILTLGYIFASDCPRVYGILIAISLLGIIEGFLNIGMKIELQKQNSTRSVSTCARILRNAIVFIFIGKVLLTGIMCFVIYFSACTFKPITLIAVITCLSIFCTCLVMSP